jgi:hypothetical protein
MMSYSRRRPAPRRSPGSSWLGVIALGVGILAGCAAPPAALPELPPAPGASTPGPQARWMYAIDLLQRGDDAQADQYLEEASRLDLGGLSHEAGNPFGDALFWRDVAEVRLALGNRDGARQAVSTSRRLLAGEERNARFDDADRQLFNRLLDALDAAARGDTAALTTLAQASPPAADPAYLAGWVAEAQQDRPAAQSAYRQYLAEVPAWGFLRRSSAMRAHAQAFLGGA